MLRFGYTDGLPPGTDTAWGCRATLTAAGALTLTPEHTDLVGPRATQLRNHLHQHVRAAWRDRAHELLHAGVLQPGHPAAVVLYHDCETVLCVARVGVTLVTTGPVGERERRFAA